MKRTRNINRAPRLQQRAALEQADLVRVDDLAAANTGRPVARIAPLEIPDTGKATR